MPRKYVTYSEKSEIDDLDQAFIGDVNTASVFPRQLYSRHPVAGSVSHLITPRDKNILYVVDKERSHSYGRHTEWQSRFGYDRFPNEYGFGMNAGGIVEPIECNACQQDEPRGVAPERFYKPANNNQTEFRQVIEDYHTNGLHHPRGIRRC